ncbi:MAG: type I-E CRISPR-associated protein Cas5/CasD [Roseiflexaceae bacterium]
MVNLLFLRLEGPLQAWGLRARWGERDTADAPTKSGIIGLIGCALGYRRGDPRLTELSSAMRLGVRIDLPGRILHDYHTTGGGSYGSQRHDGSGTRLHDQPYVGGVLSAEVDAKGRIKVKINSTTKEPETDVSTRSYLMDASFLAALQGPSTQLEAIATALQHPIWPCYLGRKACVPTTPIYAGLGMHDSLEAALATQEATDRVQLAWQYRRPEALRLLIETDVGSGNRQYDNLDHAAPRVFRPRYVKEQWCAVPMPTPTPMDPQPINTLEG